MNNAINLIFGSTFPLMDDPQRTQTHGANQSSHSMSQINQRTNSAYPVNSGQSPPKRTAQERKSKITEKKMTRLIS